MINIIQTRTNLNLLQMKNVFHARPPLLIILSLLALQLLSCKKPTEEPTSPPVAETIKLNVASETVFVGDTLRITPTITPALPNPAQKYRWHSDNESAVTIKVNSDFSVTATAIAAGTANVSVYSSAGALMASCKIIAEEDPSSYVDDGIVKILAIGNSFSEDALEQHLHQIATSAGHKVVIANLYIGGSSLSQHVANSKNDENAYAFRKINIDGSKTTRNNTSISTALADDDWDYISYQQVSNNSGQYNTFVNTLPELHAYVKPKAKNPNVKYVLHQTWAYAQNSNHEGFSNYNRNQQTMFEAIVTTYNQAKELIGADLIVPAGTAIQNGRASLIGDNFTRDGYHLSLGLGRYTASCAWFEKIFEESVVGNNYKPAGLSELEIEIAQKAAHFAVQNPNEVNPMSDYQPSAMPPLSKPALINFVDKEGIPSNWNTLASPDAGSSIPVLRDEEGTFTNASLEVTKRFNGHNPDGPQSTTTDMNLPASVSSNSYFGNSKKEFGGVTIVESALRITGLQSEKEYDLCFFAARMNVNDNRETKFIVQGSNNAVAYLNASNNNSQTSCAVKIKADANGIITVTITAGENNTNEYGFYYINAMKLSPVN